MKRYFLFLAFSVVILFASNSVAQVPSNVRSNEAISRVRPKLELELRTNRLIYGSEVFIRIFKESKELEVWIKNGNIFEEFKTYKICTYGLEGLGPKVKQDDGKAPEGFYVVTSKSMNPVSNFHLGVDLGYPNAYDRVHKRTGGALMIHGNCVSTGCYAMTDAGIEEIYALADSALRNGQPSIQVHIFPFRMTSNRIAKFSKSKWIDFWNNLKDGYDYFEKNSIPPPVKVKNQSYVFE
jgi:murein L,D-transpeptidase YafK